MEQESGMIIFRTILSCIIIMFALSAIVCGKNAIKKQIPKKPIIDDPLNDDPEIYYKCPCCGEVHNQIDIPYASFCPCCGQALDWSDQ